MADVEQWHLDKRVPIALIVTIALQTAMGVWWAASTTRAVEMNRRDIVRLETQADIMRNTAQTQAIQLGRIEEQVTGLRSDIGRLLVAIERERQ
jgi:hypothetical protein